MFKRRSYAGALTYERLVGLYLRRIEAYDKQGPRPARRHRDQSARDRNRARARRGAPVAAALAVRCTASRSRSRTTSTSATCRPPAATPCSPGTLPAATPPSSERLRDAGAIIFLKTNIDELALGSQGSEHGGRPDAQSLRSDAQSRRIERRHRRSRSAPDSRRSASAPRPASRFAAPPATTRSSASRRRAAW